MAEGLWWPSIVSPPLCAGPRPGMPLQSRRQQAAKVMIGRISLDRDLGNVHTVASGVGVWVFSWAKGEEFRPDLSAIFTKGHGRGWSAIWRPRSGIWSRKTRTLEWRKSRPECKFEIAFLLPVFLMRTAPPPSLLDKKSSSLPHQSLNLPFQYLASLPLSNATVWWSAWVGVAKI